MRKLASNEVFKKLCLVVSCASVLVSNPINSFAQTRRPINQKAPAKQASKKPIKQPTKASAPTVSRAWTGTIIYTRTQSMSDSKTTQRVSGRGQDKRDWEMRYNYRAQVAVIEAPAKNGSSLGKASITHDFSSVEKVVATEKNSCDRGKTWRDMTATSISKTETKGSASNQDANVNIGVNDDGTYTVSVGLSQIDGITTGSQSSTFSGQCVPKEPKNLTMPASQTTIEGNSLYSDGSHRINPSDPNRLSGSYSKKWQNVTETLTWNLQKGNARLRLLDLKFEEMRFPNWNEWEQITEQEGTTDGNLVRIKTSVVNPSGESQSAVVKLKETYKGDKWDGTRPDGLIEGGEFSVNLEPGEQREFELVWDSSGYAWFDDGRPRLVQRIKAELEEKGKKTDELTKNLKVAPKPVVLVHGLWSNWKAWEPWQNILTTSHSYDWKAYPVGEKSEHGLMNTGGEFLSTDPTNSIFQNSQELGKTIKYAQEDRNAWHVDVVAHSMGGLITRHYIHQFMPPAAPDGRPQIAHLVQLGTPNMGSPCADVMDATFQALGINVEAVRELREDVAEQFNRVNLNRKGVKFSVLAGNPLPVMSKRVVPNDGVVPVPSALWKIKDNALTSSLHTDLTGTSDYSKFVKPRLAIGPKGSHNPEAPEAPELPVFENQLNKNGIGARALTGAATGGGKPNFAKAVALKEKATVEVEIPVAAANDFELTFMANASVSATLLDNKGNIVGKNEAKTPAASAWVRPIIVDKPVAAGTWKLKLENNSDLELNAYLSTWQTVLK
jgi:pimeloyl-ACP methyl ester carboxylesterase